MKVISRSIVVAVLVALALVSTSVNSVFAASPVAGNTADTNQGIEAKWKDELATLQRYEFLQSQIPKWMGVWQIHHSSHARARKNKYINEVGFALQQAEMIASKHAGFDERGNVIHKNQAAQSVKKMSFYLHQLHALFRHKFNHGLHRRKH